MPKRSRYTLAFKLKVLKSYDQHKSINKVSKEFKVDRRMIRNWLTKRNVMKNARAISSRLRLQRKARPGFPELERRLVEWIDQCRSQGYIVDGNLIKQNALQCARQLGIPNFDPLDGEFSPSNGSARFGMRWTISF